MKLIVRTAFGSFKPGDEITAPEQVKATLEKWPAYVVKAAAGKSKPPAASNKES